VWHNADVVDKTGRSLEKINPLLPSHVARSWTTCTKTLGGTPGNSNSVFTLSPVKDTKISVGPNPFSPDGDGREDFAIIRYEVPLTVATLRARIYDSAGRRIRTLANNEQTGAAGEVVWDGFDDERRRARVGVYIVLVEALDSAGGIVETAKAVVVVAAKL
jgi:flagellar hook assembly protein FlgD